MRRCARAASQAPRVARSSSPIVRRQALVSGTVTGLPGRPIYSARGAREQSPMAQGLRVAAQTGDDMVVVDDLRAFGAEGTRGSSATRSEPRNPSSRSWMMHPEMADQARRHAVEYLVDGDGGVAGHRDGQLGEAGGAPNGQRLENRQNGERQRPRPLSVKPAPATDVRHHPRYRLCRMIAVRACGCRTKIALSN